MRRVLALLVLSALAYQAQASARQATWTLSLQGTPGTVALCVTNLSTGFRSQGRDNVRYTVPTDISLGQADKVYVSCSKDDMNTQNEQLTLVLSKNGAQVDQGTAGPYTGSPLPSQIIVVLNDHA
jgi:hypothetical protein